MQVADLYIREKVGQDGQTTEELWTALRKANGAIVRKLRFRDYERIAMASYPLRNQMLLHFYRYSNQTYGDMDDRTVDAPNGQKPMTRWGRKKRLTGIKITSMDMARTFRPDNNTPVHHFYFHLSEKPPERWIQIFTRVGEKRLTDARPGIPYIWMEEEHMVIRCRLKELRVVYLSDMRNIMRTTNKKYKKGLENLVKDGRKAGIGSDSMKDIVKHLYGENAPLSS